MLAALRGIIARQRITWRSLPWGFIAVAVASALSIAVPAWRDDLVYHRLAIEAGEFWRLWTGNIVHFGWLHFVADTGLWLIIGWFVERPHPALTRASIALIPLAVTGAVYFFDPGMIRYGGLSGMNVGFLVFLALAGWQKSWKDWFWPAILGIHVLELILESTWGHGAIQFDEPQIRVATIAHVGGIVFGVALWLWVNARQRFSRRASA